MDANDRSERLVAITAAPTRPTGQEKAILPRRKVPASTNP